MQVIKEHVLVEIMSTIKRAKGLGAFGAVNALTGILIALYFWGDENVSLVYEGEEEETLPSQIGGHYDLLCLRVGGEETFIPVPLVGRAVMWRLWTAAMHRRLPIRQRHYDHEGAWEGEQPFALPYDWERAVQAGAWTLRREGEEAFVPPTDWPEMMFAPPPGGEWDDIPVAAGGGRAPRDRAVSRAKRLRAA